MKKLTLIGFGILSLLFVASCEKEESDENKVVEVSLKPNEAYSYQISNFIDEDENAVISKDASHALKSQLTEMPNSNTLLFEYTPQLNYTGTDEVVVSASESKGKCGNGKGNHHHKDDEDSYTFKITIVGSQN